MIKKIIKTSGLIIVLVSVSGAQAQETRQLMESRLAYEEAKTALEDNIKEYKRSRNRFSAALEEFKIDNSQKNKKELEEQAKDLLTSSIKALSTRAGSFKLLISSLENIEEEQRNSALDILENDIKKFKDLSDALNGSDLKALKKVSTEMLEHKKTDQAIIKVMVGRTLSDRTGYLAERSRNFSRKIEEKAKELEKRGFDTGSVRTDLDELRQLAKEIEENNSAANQEFVKIERSVRLGQAPELLELNRIFNQGYAHLSKNEGQAEKMQTSMKRIVGNILSEINGLTMTDRLLKRLKLK